MEADISNKTIVVLVVLTVVISVLSTLLMMNEAQNIKAAPSRTSSIAEKTHSTQGEVKLTILPEKPVVATTGHVTLDILK